MNSILGIGIILVGGLLSAKFADKFKAPAVTAYLIIGIFLGPYVFNFVPENILKISGTISNVALSLIAFSIGQNFSKRTFQRVGKQVLWISILEAFGAWLITIIALLCFLKVPFYVAIIFGAIATATAPAALLMVIRQYKARGNFTDILMAVVAFDDAWGMLFFSISLAISKAIYAHLSTNILRLVCGVFLEIGGAFFLGGVMGFILSRVGKLLKNKTDLLICTLGTIFVTTGLALHWHISVLLSCMFFSVVVVNLDEESFKFFDVLGAIDWPLFLIFFVLAGASLELSLLGQIGKIGVVYMIFRVVGKSIGAFSGAKISSSEVAVSKYLGLGLVPQAGVALGMALIVKDQFPEVGALIFTTVVATTVIYEIIGPVSVKFALQKTGQISVHE